MATTQVEKMEAAPVALPFDPNQKHPLKHKWTFWFDSGVVTSPDDWGKNLKSIYSFETVLKIRNLNLL